MKRALVTGGTRDDVAPIAVFIKNIKETNSHLFDEIVVYHDGIRKKDQELIKNIYNTRFIEYTYRPKTKNDEVISYFSRMVYCKYECFKLLEDYDEVVWSDYDVVVLDKLDEFCTINDDELNILTCSDTLRSFLFKDIVNSEILEYDLDSDGVSTPLFALSNKLKNYNKIHEWCYDKTTSWGEDFYLPEQCAFSMAVQQFNIKIRRFPFDEYACFPTKTKGGEKIIHAAGPIKFWNGMRNDTWDRLYTEWIDMGGSKYSDLSKKIKRKWLFFYTRLQGIRYKEHG
ncbi:MAG: glycosyltransferase family 8 protein [Lachnospiraceae bacterium]|nr:glycosyltransferase family 8 protein [Lachnospiraceae bacterium]